jgi:hypothetical protein
MIASESSEQVLDRLDLSVPIRSCVSETHRLPFDRNSGILIVQTPNALTTEMLGRRWLPTTRRVIRRAQMRLQGVPVQEVWFQSRR